jgi:hypothetical protein
MKQAIFCARWASEVFEHSARDDLLSGERSSGTSHIFFLLRPDPHPGIEIQECFRWRKP